MIESSSIDSVSNAATKHGACDTLIGQIGELNWSGLAVTDLTQVAWAYYYFSIQFRENLETARALHPDDELFAELASGECDTNNLSPWPGVAAEAEKMNHDEFMRRALGLSAITPDEQSRLHLLGEAYLRKTRGMDDNVRAMSISSYEDGGLEAVFKAFLRAPTWTTPLLAAFRHFLEKHIEFDSDPDHGHGALCRHLVPDDRVAPLWQAFRDMLVDAAPALRRPATHLKELAVQMKDAVSSETQRLARAG